MVSGALAAAGLSGRGPTAPRWHPSGMAEKARLRAPRPYRSRPGSAERQGSKPLSLRMLTFAALWCAQYVIGDYKRCANQEFWSQPAALDPSSPFRLRIFPDRAVADRTAADTLCEQSGLYSAAEGVSRAAPSLHDSPLEGDGFEL